MLITSAVGVPMGEAVGAFLVCAGLITLCGLRLVRTRIDRIPLSLASGMLAGVCCASA
jgi:benzoate membrane transport protein